MSDLPPDLIEEILTWIPAMSLKRLRSTCKGWNTLLKDPRFTEKHLRRAAKPFQVVMLKNYKVSSMSVNLNIAPPTIEFKGALDLKDSYSNSDEQVDIANVCHCDGLLLCNTKDNRLVVWNPCIGETKWIQPKTGYKKGQRFALGYQNNKSCRSYKILRYWDNYESDDIIVACEVYEFSSGTWKVLDDINPKCLTLRIGSVSFKGSTYWLSYDKTSDGFLVCFDFTTERFRRLCLPPPQRCKALSVVRDEQLLVLQKISDTSKMEIWLTNKFDTKAALLWSKSFTVDLHVYVFTSLLIDEEKKVALCFDLNYVVSGNKIYTIGKNDKYYTEIPFLTRDDTWWLGNNVGQVTNKSNWWPVIFHYVPSLVQIQQCRGKRKERD